MSIKPYTLEQFVSESNKIEGLSGYTADQLYAHRALLDLEQVRVDDLENFVNVVQPGAVLRTFPGMDVIVRGSRRHRDGRIEPLVFRPPPGGPAIRKALNAILKNEAGLDPWQQHCSYETLHPFTDGNGRSGRALYLWRMGGIDCVPLGFLHDFYYETLRHVGRIV